MYWDRQFRYRWVKNIWKGLNARVQIRTRGGGWKKTKFKTKKQGEGGRLFGRQGFNLFFCISYSNVINSSQLFDILVLSNSPGKYFLAKWIGSMSKYNIKTELGNLILLKLPWVQSLKITHEISWLDSSKNKTTDVSNNAAILETTVALN